MDGWVKECRKKGYELHIIHDGHGQKRDSFFLYNDRISYTTITTTEKGKGKNWMDYGFAIIEWAGPLQKILSLCLAYVRLS